MARRRGPHLLSGWRQPAHNAIPCQNDPNVLAHSAFQRHVSSMAMPRHSIAIAINCTVQEDRHVVSAWPSTCAAEDSAAVIRDRQAGDGGSVHAIDGGDQAFRQRCGRAVQQCILSYACTAGRGGLFITISLCLQMPVHHLHS